MSAFDSASNRVKAILVTAKWYRSTISFLNNRRICSIWQLRGHWTFQCCKFSKCEDDGRKPAFDSQCGFIIYLLVMNSLHNGFLDYCVLGQTLVYIWPQSVWAKAFWRYKNLHSSCFLFHADSTQTHCRTTSWSFQCLSLKCFTNIPIYEITTYCFTWLVHNLLLLLHLRMDHCEWL